MDRSTASLRSAYWRAGVLGVVAGVRAAMPLAALAASANRGGAFAGSAAGPERRLRSRGALVGLGLSMVGEMIVDKLPIAPSRLAPGPFGGRLVSGALAGLALCRDAGAAPLLGAALGAAGAGAGATAATHSRLFLQRTRGVPNVALGLLEDVIVLALSYLALRRPEAP